MNYILIRIANSPSYIQEDWIQVLHKAHIHHICYVLRNLFPGSALRFRPLDTQPRQLVFLRRSRTIFQLIPPDPSIYPVILLITIYNSSRLSV